jgi:hypothetical protein
MPEHVSRIVMAGATRIVDDVYVITKGDRPTRQTHSGANVEILAIKVKSGVKTIYLQVGFGSKKHKHAGYPSGVAQV